MSDKIYCPACGAEVEARRTYCSCCGASLRGDGHGHNSEFYGIPPMMYQQGYGVPEPENNKLFGGFAIAGLVVGIISLLCCCFSYVGIVIGIAGIVFSAVGLKGTRNRGCAVAGLICSITGTIISLVEIAMISL